MLSLLELLPENKRLRIDLLSPPFSGHLHPVLALGRALSVQHDVRIISTDSALAKIEAAGLQGIALMGKHEQALMAVANPQYAVGSNPLRLYRQFKSSLELLKLFGDQLDNLYCKSPSPDLIIADFTLPIAGIVAQKLGITWWTSLPSPCVLETPDGPPSYCGGLRPAQTRWEHIQQAVSRKKVRLFKLAVFQLFRKLIQELGLAKLYRTDGSEAAYSAERILALGDESIEFTRTWPKSVRFIGPALYTPPIDSPSLVFQPDKKHVLITLGTHLAWHKDEVVKSVIGLARSRPDWIFHFSNGDSLANGYELSANFIRLPYVDYDKYLQYYDAVIHHGGAGIMYYCLKLNKPALVYPVDYDQFDHAARLEAAGKAIWIKNGLIGLENCALLLEKMINRYDETGDNGQEKSDLLIDKVR